MLTLRDQICDVELCLKLKELGFEPSALFYYVKRKPALASNGETINYEWGVLFIEQFDDEHGFDINDYNVCPALTEAEVMAALPAFVTTKKGAPFDNFWLALQKRTALNIQYIINYHCDTHAIDHTREGLESFMFPLMLMEHNIFDTKLANALAKMLIYLIENGLLVLSVPCTKTSEEAVKSSQTP